MIVIIIVLGAAGLVGVVDGLAGEGRLRQVYVYVCVCIYVYRYIGI